MVTKINLIGCIIESLVSTCRFEGCVKYTWKQNALKCKLFKPHKENRTKAGGNTVLDLICVDPVIVWLPVMSYFQLSFFYFNRIKTFGHGNVYYIVGTGKKWLDCTRRKGLNLRGTPTPPYFIVFVFLFCNNLLYKALKYIYK